MPFGDLSLGGVMMSSAAAELLLLILLPSRSPTSEGTEGGAGWLTLLSFHFLC